MKELNAAEEPKTKEQTDTVEKTEEKEQSTPAAAPDSGEKDSERMFTQEEVNSIVRDRLKRVKGGVTEEEINKAVEAAIGERAAELDRKENYLKCRELVYSEKYPEEFLEVLDTSDYEKFAEKADMLTIAFQNKTDDPMKDAMLRPEPHKPKIIK